MPKIYLKIDKKSLSIRKSGNLSFFSYQMNFFIFQNPQIFLIFFYVFEKKTKTTVELFV